MYGYADENPLDGTDRSGLCTSFDHATCAPLPANVLPTSVMTDPGPPTKAQTRAAKALGTDLGMVMVQAQQMGNLPELEAAQATAGYACGKGGDGGIPGELSSACQTHYSLGTKISTERMDLEVDADDLAAAAQELGTLTGQIKSPSLSVMDVVGLVAGGLAVVAGGAAMAAAATGADALATSLTAATIGTGAISTSVDAEGCFGGDQSTGACVGFAFGLASLVAVGAGTALDAAANSAAETPAGAVQVASAGAATSGGMTMTQFLGNLGDLTGVFTGLDAVVLDNAEAYVSTNK